MAVIKLVTNGNGSATFKAVSLGHAVTVLFGLLSIIGCLATWGMAITWDRRMLVELIRDEMATTMKAQSTATNLALAQLDARMHDLEVQAREHEQQIIRNTERLNHVAKAWK